MNQVLLSSTLFPLSYYFMGLRLIDIQTGFLPMEDKGKLLAALIVVLLYIFGSPTGRFRHK